MRSLLAVLALLPSTTLAQPLATHIYAAKTIHTADINDSTSEAIAIANDRIIALGSFTDLQSHIGPDTAVRFFPGATILPGLIDAHGHLTGLGALKIGVVDLAGTTSYEQVIERVQQRAEETPEGTWVLGRGWDHESWPAGDDGSKPLPTHDALTEAVPDHPVWLGRVDGHSALANEAAMEAAGISPESVSPEGGEIIRDADGNATGVFIDNAETLVQRVIPTGAEGRPRDLILAGQQACFEVGLTGVHDMGASPDMADLYRRLEASGELKLRVDLAISEPYAVPYFENTEPYFGDRLSVAAVKLYADGAMGSRGAWLLEPYTDRPTGPDGEPYTGLAVMDPERIEFISTHALTKGYQIRAHAIGDRGNREVLDAYESAAESTGADLEAARFRVEHAQLLAPSDIPRFARLGVIASMQQTHCTSDMRWIADRVGESRSQGAYAWRSLVESGAVFAGGSDFPVESHIPFLGFYASITRQNAVGWPEGGWHPHERLSREETLRSFTINAAYAAFSEDNRGSLEPGKLADFIVIDRDIMTCRPKDILETEVLHTFIAGEEVYAAPQETRQPQGFSD